MDISTKQTLFGPNAIPLLAIPLYNKIVIGSIETLYCRLNKVKTVFQRDRFRYDRSLWNGDFVPS